MKVALVTNSFPTLSETFLYNQAAGLQAAGIDLTVVATRPSTDAALFEDFDGARFTGPVRYTAAGRLRAAGEPAMWRGAHRHYGLSKRAVRATLLASPLAGFDVVHFAYSGIAVAWLDALPLLPSTRFVVSCRGSAERITPLVDTARAEKLRAMFELVHRVHCVSADMRDVCASYGLDARKAFVNHPAVDAARFRRSAPYQPRASGPLRLLSTGRLHWAKGLEFGLLAVRQLVDAGQALHYEIIGSGPDEDRLRYAIRDLALADHVTLAGKRSSTEVRAALERADVYVLPSVSEGISNAALEAMAMELPVVSTTTGGMSEAIADDVDGMLVPSRDPAALATAIASLVDDPAQRAVLGRAARQRIERDFSLERQVRTFAAEYAALAAR